MKQKAKDIFYVQNDSFYEVYVKTCLECKLNVHKRCTRNVANDCGLDKKRLATVLAGLNINTESQKIVRLDIIFHSITNVYAFVF
jgi:hypothetical protein